MLPTCLVIVPIMIVSLLSACAPATPQIVRETVVVVQVITPTPGAPTTAPTPLPPSPSPLPTLLVFDPTVPPPPTPTPPRLLAVAIPGDKDKIDGRVIFPDISPFRTEIWFQVRARDPRRGTQDGAGIKTVEFVIQDKTGEVYRQVETNPAYCAFGGGEPNCNVFRFASNNFRWSKTNKPIQNGAHTLTVQVTPQSGDQWNPVVVDFQIQVAR